MDRNRQISNILLVGSQAHGSLENAYLKAFRNLGVRHVEIFDVDRHRQFLRGSRIAVRLYNRLAWHCSNLKIRVNLLRFLTGKERSSHYDVVIVFKGAEFSRHALEACRLRHPLALWVNYNPDDPFNVDSRGSTNANIIKSLSFYDVYYIWSKRLIDKLRGHGCRNVHYLPFGYDSEFHTPPSDSTPIIPGRVSFIGAWDPQREAILTKLADFDLQIIGNGWGRISKYSPIFRKIVPRNIYGQDLSRAIFSSAACLNLLRSQNTGAHNMRTFEIPAMGGLMLTTRSEEQNEFFPEEIGSLMFDDIKELRDQLNRVIGNQVLAQRIRSRCVELVQGHSYTERARHLLDSLRGF